MAMSKAMWIPSQSANLSVPSKSLIVDYISVAVMTDSIYVKLEPAYSLKQPPNTH